jgi:hypothetical protein
MNQHLNMQQHNANYHDEKPIPIQISCLAVSTPHTHGGIVGLSVHHKNCSATNKHREHQLYVIVVVTA